MARVLNNKFSWENVSISERKRERVREMEREREKLEKGR